MKLIIYIFIFLFSVKLASAENYPIVVSNSSTEDTTLTRLELVRVFTRRNSHWIDGHKITVFIKDMNSLEHRLFTMDVLNISPYKYKTLVDSVVYSGENTPPIELSNDNEMMSKLLSTPYSIGYLNYTIVINLPNNIIQINYE